MLIAQALGEYAAASIVVQAITNAWRSTRQFVVEVEPSTWMILAFGVFAALYVRNRFL